MVKKVKTYLTNAEIIEDENRLLEIGNQCEPGNVVVGIELLTKFKHRSIDGLWEEKKTIEFLLVFHFLEHTNQKISEFGEIRDE